MIRQRSNSVRKLLRCLVQNSPASLSSRRRFNTIAVDESRREAKCTSEDEGCQTLLGRWRQRPTNHHESYRRPDLRSHKSRVESLLERSTRSESVRERIKEKLKQSRSTGMNAMMEELEFSDAEKRFSPDALSMYELILEGDEKGAWKMFRRVIAGEQEGEPSASIWHWYIMIGLAARDSTVPIKDVFRMAYHSKKVPFSESAIFRSLRDKDELGGVIGQQRVLAFTLMHNLRKRMTEEANRAVLSIWHSMRLRKITPSTRHVNAMCVTLIHMGRQEEALTELRKRMKTTSVGPYQEDLYGWMTSKEGEGVQMNAYTVTMMMFAFLTEGFPIRAYEMYKVSVSEIYTVPIHGIALTLLLWAGKQPYEGIAFHQLSDSEDANEQDLQHRTKGVEAIGTKDSAHWKSQAIWDGHPAAVQARHIFKTYLFRHHPELREAINPLYEVRAGDDHGLLWKTHAGLQRWSRSLNNLFVAPLVRWESYRADARLMSAPTHDDVPGAEKLRLDENTFDHYLQLLPYVSMFEEVPWEEYTLVLAWMKHLDIKPGYYCLLTICWALDHLVPPAAEFASCAGPLHDYLADWVGEEQIPTRAELAAFHRWNRF